MDILADLIPILRAFFRDESLSITPQTTARDVPGWDSLANAVLMVVVEEYFGVRINADDLPAFQNVGDLAGAIARQRS